MSNNKNFIAKNGVSTGDGYSMPDVRPSLLLDFANSKTLDPRITFTRGSTATYWDGKTTTKAEENLIPYSQEFDASSWSNSSITVTANDTTAPDGTTTAESLSATGDNYIGYSFSSVISGTTYTFSVYAKHNSGYVQLSGGTAGFGSQSHATFDVQNGSVTDTASNVTSTSITDVGNSWYRISMTVTSTGTGASGLYITVTSDSAPSSARTSSGAASCYIWGAQAEIRSSATAYTATTSSPIVKYQPTLQTAASGEARFDHDPVTGESKGLLIEDARTNLATYSEAFNSWTKLASTIESNVAIAPDGTLTADKVVPDATNTAAHRVSISQSFTLGTSYAFSVYAKAGEKQYIDVRWYDGSTNAARVVFDVSNGTVTNTYAGTGVVEDVGNGWYRCAVYAPATNTTVSGFALIYVEATSTGNVTYQGNGYDGLYLWGAQFEAGAFPTSYIPTSGSTVTRSTDDASITDVSTISPSGEGTLFADAFSRRPVSAHSSSYIIARFSSDTDNYVDLRYRSSGASGETVTALGSSKISATSVNPAAQVDVKLVVSYSYDSFAAAGNGSSVTTATGTALPELTTMSIGSLSGVNNMAGTIKKIAFYPQRISNATLQAMTEE